jgi:hypothetical protein
LGAFATLPANGNYLREADGWSRRKPDIANRNS